MRICYTRPEDGGVSIVIAAAKSDLERVLGPLTDEAYAAHVIERSIPEGALNVQVMPDNWEAPTDRTFREAWTHDGKDVTINMIKARDIWRDKMRAARAPLLAALDTAYMRADEAGNLALKANITAQKQALRDITADPSIESAQTPEELKAVWPVNLGSNR